MKLYDFEKIIKEIVSKFRDLCMVYNGRDIELQLPRGVYIVTVGGEVQKIVL